MDVKTLNDMYESGYLEIVCESLTSEESNTDIVEAEKNYSYLKEIEVAKLISKVPRDKWLIITNAVKRSKEIVEAFKK